MNLTVADSLVGVGRVFLDSTPAIYALENDAEFGPRTWNLLNHCARESILLVASPVTLAECLAGIDGARQMRRYVEFLTGSVEVEFFTLGELEAVQAAQLRRTSKLKLPDCLQISCAIQSGCDLFLTNDRDIQKHQNAITVLCVSDLV